MQLPTIVAVSVLIASPLVYHVLRIYRNYRLARAIHPDIPVFIMPLSPTNPIWYMFSPALHRLMVQIGCPGWFRFGWFGWEKYEAARPFLELDTKALVLVSPERNWLSLADASAVPALFASERKGEITRLRDAVKMLEIFGPNITTVG
jgi:hypothetical protein